MTTSSSSAFFDKKDETINELKLNDNEQRLFDLLMRRLTGNKIAECKQTIKKDDDYHFKYWRYKKIGRKPGKDKDRKDAQGALRDTWAEYNEKVLEKPDESGVKESSYDNEREYYSYKIIDFKKFSKFLNDGYNATVERVKKLSYFSEDKDNEAILELIKKFEKFDKAEIKKNEQDNTLSSSSSTKPGSSSSGSG